MNIAVRYYSRTVHTQKVAEAIGQAVGTQALTIDVPIEERIDIFFLGSPLYYEGISAKMR